MKLLQMFSYPRSWIIFIGLLVILLGSTLWLTEQSDIPAFARPGENVMLHTLDDCDDPYLIVNREHIYPVDECLIPDLVPANTYSGIDSPQSVLIRRLIAPDVERLFIAAAAAGYPLRLHDGWRDCKAQEEVFERTAKLEGSEAAAHTYTYRCGQSSHHTGMVIDLKFAETDYAPIGEYMADTETYQWLKENAAQFSCAEEYPEGKEQITGLLFEPWHYRCGLPVEVAQQIQRGETTVIEWLESMQ